MLVSPCLRLRWRGGRGSGSVTGEGSRRGSSLRHVLAPHSESRPRSSLRDTSSLLTQRHVLAHTRARSGARGTWAKA
jgi:hypothetical protein